MAIPFSARGNRKRRRKIDERRHKRALMGYVQGTGKRVGYSYVNFGRKVGGEDQDARLLAYF